jgi:transposase InsO family protein
MPYTTNPKMPKLRRDAVRLMYRGWSARKVGRYLGFHHTAVLKWMKNAKQFGDRFIPTKSSRPKHHPKEGIVVSLSSVKRTLDRRFLLKKKSLWKRYHPHQERPKPLQPGDLVQLDTIHLMVDKKKRIYIFVAIDVYSRWVYARAYERMSSAITLDFVREAQQHASFHFKMLQSDHGPEFGMWFVSQIKKSHRYTRIGKPNDNAHIERFNRTVQEECLDKIPTNVKAINCALKKYLRYYNYERLHFGINFLTPMQVVPSY